MLHHLGLHHGIHQHLVRALHGGQHIQAFHQVGHANIVMSLRLSLAGPQQFFVKQVVGMLGVEHYVILVVWVGMYPYRVLAALEDSSKDGSE